MTETTLTYNSIIPVGTRLRYIGNNGTLSSSQVYVVTSQDVTHDDETYWVHLSGADSGRYNPRIFVIVEELQPSEIWTL